MLTCHLKDKEYIDKMLKQELRGSYIDDFGTWTKGIVTGKVASCGQLYDYNFGKVTFLIFRGSYGQAMMI